MDSLVIGFSDIDQSKHNLVGGKAAGLGELSRIDGIQVPEGFCLTTEAYKVIVGNNSGFKALLKQLLNAGNKKSIYEIAAKIRAVIENLVIPNAIITEIDGHINQLGERNAYAIRSSATAEDLPTASFAGQQDTYLNIIGKEAIYKHICRCWASLYSDRAILYRLQNGFNHEKVLMSVVIQKMIFPGAAGIMFTADPVNGNRKILSVDAGFGLGESIVSGKVNADHYKVHAGKIIARMIPAKKISMVPLKDGGTIEQDVEFEKQNSPVLTDVQVLQLEQLGRKIEGYFRTPQDIEWCLAGNEFYIVQSRPITTLFPVPGVVDGENRVYISVGHQQMMTDAMKPLGLSFFLMTTRAPMRTAGGRLFVDVTPQLASPGGKKVIIDVLGKSDPLIRDALMTIVSREDFIKTSSADMKAPGGTNFHKYLSQGGAEKIDNDPAIIDDLINRGQASLENLRQVIPTKSGTALFDFILEDMQELKRILFDPQNFSAIMTAMNATLWINENLNEWLGEKNAADLLSQSAPNNITSEMGLALLDVSDHIRPYPELISYLQQAKDDDVLDGMTRFDGGLAVNAAIVEYLDKYGMRCSGEIDITKLRWSEKPATLIPLILSNIRNFSPGENTRRFEQGRREAAKKEQEILMRLKELPDGEEKASETARVTRLMRDFIGYREYPKYAMVNRYFIYKQALLKEAEQLVAANLIREKEDVFFLSFEEFREAVQFNKLDYRIISERKIEFELFEKLTPPRVITSDGEIISGAYERESLPTGAIAGLAVSSGVVEGHARVIVNMEEANIKEGDILVTVFTDPSWTPLFVSIKGLVTEVGGLMTHGSVIAREYGLPAVVGVENITKLIKDGQRIRVNGTEGFVEIL